MLAALLLALAAGDAAAPIPLAPAPGAAPAASADAEGNLELHGLPRETIGAVAPGTARPLGSFSNDGTQNTWTIVIPKEH
jgi:hypothetical protein